MTIRSRAAVAALLLILAIVSILLIMGRPPICACGEVNLWGTAGPQQSQMLADWYSASHVVHGFLFYAALHFAARGWSIERRFLAALVIEAAWEIIQNTPAVVDP